jgi:ATP-dependent protease HslVU (ClpYQ) peptidase subunit
MAGDSQTTCHNEVTGWATKIHKLDDGRIIGACGPSVCCIKFRTHMIEGGDKPTLSDDFCALILKPGGNVVFVDKEMIEIPYRLPAGIGSGSEFAIGAMMAGASPVDAVALAIDRDCKSGGEITVQAL